MFNQIALKIQVFIRNYQYIRDGKLTAVVIAYQILA